MTNYSSLPGNSKWRIPTPALIVDIDILDENIRKMRDYAASKGKMLRPHAKTHKCVEIARRQLAAGNCAGICVAKVSEAEVLASAGIKDTLITSPVVSPDKIARLIKCLSSDPGMAVVVDSLQNAADLAAAARAAGKTLSVMIDIDSGLGRTGVSFSDALSFGRKVAAVPGLALKGVQCYAGHLQHVKSYEERKKASLDGLLKAAETVRVLREEFPDCAVFTGTGTGTHDIDSAVPELTDMQTGSYVFMDAEYMETGSAANPDVFLTFKPSLRLLTTVVSSNQPQWVTVDAGLKAMYYTENVRPVIFGHEKEGWLYRWYGDEHGKIIVPSPEQKPALGEVLELCVSHCDPTVNLHDKLYIVKDDLVIDQWKIDSRGRCE